MTFKILIKVSDSSDSDYEIYDKLNNELCRKCQKHRKQKVIIPPDAEYDKLCGFGCDNTLCKECYLKDHDEVPSGVLLIQNTESWEWEARRAEDGVLFFLGVFIPNIFLTLRYYFFNFCLIYVRKFCWFFFKYFIFVLKKQRLCFCSFLIS